VQDFRFERAVWEAEVGVCRPVLQRCRPRTVSLDLVLVEQVEVYLSEVPVV